MQTQTSVPPTPRDLRGKKLRQSQLAEKLSEAIAGQTPGSKAILIVLMVALCLPTGMLAGFIAGNCSLNVSMGQLAAWEWRGVAIITCVTLAIATLQSWRKGALALLLSFIGVLSVFRLLGVMGSIQWLHDSWIITTLILAFALGISSFCWLVLRFILALADILLRNPRLLKGVVIVGIVLAASLGGQMAIASEISTPDSGFKTALEASASLRFWIVIVSAIYGATLGATAWFANRRRQTPWHHPDLLRSWVLAIGSWQGTCFQDLDLSGIDLQGATLANTDLRARKLYRTNFQGVKGLARARVDSRYLDLENRAVQKLLTHGCSEQTDFQSVNCRGAYLRGADLRRYNFTDANLTGADFQDADLRGSILVCAQLIDTNFTNANLTGICIKDWSINSQTCFTNVQCDYIYREIDEKGEPTSRYPSDRNFEAREFESLFQEVENVVEMILKEGVNWRAFAFSLQKLQIDDEGLGLELKGFEKRGDLWVVKVSHNGLAPKAEIEQRLSSVYDEMKMVLAAKEEQINKLLGIAANQAETIKTQAKQPLGNHFFINGSTITNLTGSGQIEYNEAANQIRTIVEQTDDPRQVVVTLRKLINQLNGQSVATKASTQLEFIQQMIQAEANQDEQFKYFLMHHASQIIDAMPKGQIAAAVQQAIANLSEA